MKNPKPIQTSQFLIERLASLLRNESRQLLAQHGLQPVQFEALHYLALCNRYSDTPMGVTEFLGQTKGTVSQSLKVLEREALIKKQLDSRDKRVTHLSLTDKGKDLLEGLLPSPILSLAANQLGEEMIQQSNHNLAELLKVIQQSHGFKSFGQCLTCKHNEKRSQQEYFCLLTQEALSVEDVALICREHELNAPDK